MQRLLLDPRLSAHVTEEQRAYDSNVYNLGHALLLLDKIAGQALVTHALSGELYVSKSGWLLLSVPNALVRGAFDALDEHGAELPYNKDDKLTAHISVMTADEVRSIGGADKITERGHHFRYTLGPIKTVQPATWDGVSRVWYITVVSTELQNLRKSYGLSPKPRENDFDFHITIAVRRTHILRENDVSKAASAAIVARWVNGLLATKDGARDCDKESSGGGHQCVGSTIEAAARLRKSATSGSSALQTAAVLASDQAYSGITGYYAAAFPADA